MGVDFGETNFEFTFMSDGTVLESVTDDTGLFCDEGMIDCTEGPDRYIQTDVNLLICDPGCDEILDYTISGNTLNISFDGGHDNGHTLFTATFVRTSASGPPLCGPVESLVGEWTATSLTIGDGPDLVDLGLLLVETFFSNGTFTQVVVDAPPETFCDGTSCGDGGRYIQTDVNLLTCDPHCDEILDYTISGNTLTISFDGGEDDTPFTATFVKTPGNGVTSQATGSGVRAGRIGHLQFSAIAMADGSVSGQYNLTFEGSGNFRLQAEVTCLRVVGNQAWIGGVIKSSTNPARVGREGGFVVEDNGDGGGAPPDRVSLMFVNLDPGGAAAVCAGDTGIDRTLRDIDSGNVQVH